MVMLEKMPGELHLEILRQLDVPSIFTMRLVNRYFRQLMEDNEETIIRGCLQNVECLGPHAILLDFFPLSKPENTTFVHAKRLRKTKDKMMSVARMLRQTQKAKINALYCIQHTCVRARELIMLNQLNDDDTGLMTPRGIIERLRKDLLGDYTTDQIQHMLPLYIRLVFKTAEFLHFEFRGSSLPWKVYFQCNNLILARGPEFLLELEELSTVENVDELEEALSGMVKPYFSRFVVVHEELINELQRRGSGLMTDPGIEIQQFLQEEDTTLDIRTSGGDHT